jgi:hypothetical protein
MPQLLPLRLETAAFPCRLCPEVLQFSFVTALARFSLSCALQQAADPSFQVAYFIAHGVALTAGFVEFFLQCVNTGTQFLQSCFFLRGVGGMDRVEDGE